MFQGMRCSSTEREEHVSGLRLASHLRTATSRCQSSRFPGRVPRRLKQPYAQHPPRSLVIRAIETMAEVFSEANTGWPITQQSEERERKEEEEKKKKREEPDHY